VRVVFALAQLALAFAYAIGVTPRDCLKCRVK